jgi:hypothetical protein
MCAQENNAFNNMAKFGIHIANNDEHPKKQ